MGTQSDAGTEERSSALEFRAILSASYVSGAALILLNGLPLLLGAADDTFHLGPERLGYLGGVAGLSALFVNATIPFWIRRVDWRRATRVLTIIALMILTVGATFHTYIALLATFSLLGISLGLLGAPAFARLGDAVEPRSAFSWSIGLAMGITAVWSLLSPAYIQPRFGYRGAILSLGAIVFPCVFLARWLKAPGPLKRDDPKLSRADCLTLSDRLTPLVVPCLALFLYTCGVTVFYAFLDRLGNHLGLSEAWVGATIAVASLASAVAAICSARWGERLAPHTVLSIATLLIVLCDWTVFFRGPAPFMLSVVAWNVGWALSYPQYLALVRRSDITHRLYTASPAIVSLASFAGAASGGLLIERANFGVAIATSASFLIAALGLSGGAELMLRHRQPLTST